MIRTKLGRSTVTHIMDSHKKLGIGFFFFFMGESVTQAEDREMGYKCKRLPHDPADITCMIMNNKYSTEGVIAPAGAIVTGATIRMWLLNKFISFLAVLTWKTGLKKM